MDGEVHLRNEGGLKRGDIVEMPIEDSDQHDLYTVAKAPSPDTGEEA